MKKSKEQKPNIVHRLITSTLKFTTKEAQNDRSKSPVHQFNYELPKSFLKAVDKARVSSGYDILPRFRPRSASPITQQKTSSSSLASSHNSYEPQQIKSKTFRSSSTNDIDRVCTKKVQFRRIPRRTIQQQQQPTNPLLFSPRPRFCMMMNPNFMMMNRPRQPFNILPIRSPLRQPTMFRLFR